MRGVRGGVHRAHPRERGELPRQRAPKPDRGGSSPRARGTLNSRRGMSPTGGLIPASAGNSISSTRTRPWPWAHPRERGELRANPPRNRRLKGSSPRARGTLLLGQSYPADGGLIPASAGNSSRRWGAHRCRWAHPRERGELEGRVMARARRSGSSPRARGTPGMTGVSFRLRRLIPASAGNSGPTPERFCRSWAHPRERGELAAV